MSASTSTPASAPMSLPGRLIKIFFSPGEVFESLKDKPASMGVLAVGAAILALTMAVMPADIWIEMMREQASQRGTPLPPGMESGAWIIKLFAVLGGAVMYFIMAFVMAGIATFVFNFLMGGEGKYGQYLTVVSHASLIVAVSSLLLLPLRIIQHDPSLTLNIGTFLPFLEEGYAFRTLKLLDLFAFWSYAVMAIGITKIDPRRGLGGAFAFFMIFGVGIAMIFGIFGG